MSSTATYAQIEEVLSNQPSNIWSISDDLARLLARAVNELRLVNVLEFGAGLSSLTLATALSTRSGGQLTSVEQEPEWCRPVWREVEKMSNIAVDPAHHRHALVYSPEGTCGQIHRERVLACAYLPRMTTGYLVMVMCRVDMQVIHVQADVREEWNTLVAQELSFALLQSWEWG